MADALTITAGAQVLARNDEFEHFVREHQRRIHRLLFSILRDREAAETLTQECFLRAFERAEDFRGEAQPGTWLVRIAVNLARDFMRNRRLQFWRQLTRQSRDSADMAEMLTDARCRADQLLITREQLRDVWSVVGRLSLRQRTIFMLRFVEEMKTEEIAASLGLKPATVRLHLFRAVHAVQKAVKR